MTDGASLSGCVGDDVSIDQLRHSATFDNKNVGTGKTVTVTGATLSGHRRRQLHASQPTGRHGEHHGEAVTGSFTAANKVYDGNAARDG